jgi:hypothetical protein
MAEATIQYLANLRYLEPIKTLRRYSKLAYAGIAKNVIKIQMNRTEKRLGSEKHAEDRCVICSKYSDLDSRINAKHCRIARILNPHLPI